MLVIATISLFIFPSCNKDSDEPAAIEENEALYELMNDYYYWNDELPELNPNVYESPYTLLEALRHRPLDRWSYISTYKEHQDYYVESKYIGHGFGSAWDGDGKLRITLVYAQTQIHEAGVRRGWILEAINGVSLQTTHNINQMVGENAVGVNNNFLFRKPDNTLVELSLQKQEVAMNNVLHVEVFERASRKIGYIVLNAFTEPTLVELQVAFAYLANEGIQELILDLRYNGGGQDYVANNLAGMIGGLKVAGKTFIKYEFNADLSSENFSYDFVEVDVQLDIDRLITICSNQTASASEVIINGLRPYMPVFTVGEKTYGKPMGMQVWNYSDEYMYVPITFKVKNANDEGDYFDGIEADILAIDDLKRNFGDPEEASLKQALAFIEQGLVAKALTEERPPYTQPWEQMSGFRAQIGVY